MNKQTLTIHGKEISIDQIKQIILTNGETIDPSTIEGKGKDECKQFYDEFYKLYPKLQEGFRSFFTYVPSVDNYLMSTYAKGEYSAAFSKLYEAWKDKINEEEFIPDGSVEVQDEQIKAGTDFTKPQPQELLMIQEVFTKEPDEIINIRNEKLLAQDKSGMGKNMSGEDLLVMQQLTTNYHISMSNNFINDYLNGAGYNIQQQRDEQAVMNKKRKLRRYSKQKYMKGGFSDTDITPILQDQTYTITYQAPPMDTQPVPGTFVVDNGVSNGVASVADAVAGKGHEIENDSKGVVDGGNDEESSSEISQSTTEDDQEVQYDDLPEDDALNAKIKENIEFVEV